MHGFTKTAELLDQLKALGFKYSTQGAMTISVSDMVIPKEKYEYIHATEKRIADIEKQYQARFHHRRRALPPGHRGVGPRPPRT